MNNSQKKLPLTYEELGYFAVIAAIFVTKVDYMLSKVDINLASQLQEYLENAPNPDKATLAAAFHVFAEKAIADCKAASQDTKNYH